MTFCLEKSILWVPSDKSNSGIQIHSIVNRSPLYLSSLIVTDSAMIPFLVYVGLYNAAEAPELEELSFRVSFSGKELEKGRDRLLTVSITVGILNGEI